MARTVTGESSGVFGSYTSIQLPQCGIGSQPSAPAVPATTITATNPVPVSATVVIAANGATITNVNVNGVSAGSGAGTCTVPSGGNIAITYTVATPTWTWTWPALPASTVAFTTTADRAVQVVITGGTMTAVVINGVTVGAGAGTYTVPAFGTIAMTYSVAPTWAWSVPVTFLAALNANGTPVSVTGVS